MAHQGLPEGVFLRYPENLGSHMNIDIETAVNMLLRATQLAQQVPFAFSYIDKPQDGQVFLLFMPNLQAPFQPDGVRYLDQEAKHTIPVQNRELEVHEVKYGFIPGSQDPAAYRIRRRFRLNKGGHPQLVLLHYSRGPSAPIPPQMMNQPIRPYPLRPINEPPIYVAGERMGQKVFPNMAQMPPNAPNNMPNLHGGMPGMPPNMPGGFNRQAQAMMAQQNSNMDALERRNQAGVRPGDAGRGPRPPIPDDDSGDEAEMISVRSLAMNRYRRNHELMNEVFIHAAFGDKTAQSKPSPYSIFDKADLEEKTIKLQAEIEALKARSVSRKEGSGTGDVTMSVDAISA
ncbi:hypothetical protein ONZ45_g2395 [Pleurotus djamor]|nr:hypothetical protein ONZ45_g2395 [Pleurotus djamor]